MRDLPEYERRDAGQEFLAGRTIFYSVHICTAFSPSEQTCDKIITSCQAKTIVQLVNELNRHVMTVIDSYLDTATASFNVSSVTNCDETH